MSTSTFGTSTTSSSATSNSAASSSAKPDYRAMIIEDLTVLAEKYAAMKGINPRYLAIFEIAKLFLH